MYGTRLALLAGMRRSSLVLAACVALVGCASDPEDLGGDGSADDIDWSTVEECFNFDLECDGDTVCKPVSWDESRHACLPAEPEGYCDDDSDCGDDGFCVGEVGWLSLWDVFAQDEPGAGRCHAISEEGEPCYNFNFECRGDLVCRPAASDSSYQTCQPAGPGDGYCDDDDDCDPANGIYCLDERAGINAGQCGLVKGADERCLIDWECADGLSCVPQGVDSFCLPLLDKGGKCDSDDDCKLPYSCDYGYYTGVACQ